MKECAVIYKERTSNIEDTKDEEDAIHIHALHFSVSERYSSSLIDVNLPE